jgi:acetate kinase
VSNKIESEPDKQDEKLSICDIMKEDTSEIIKKMESQIPVLFQNYSEIYTQYLHSLDDIFGTCYIAEKEFFDKLNIDKSALEQIKKNSKIIKENYFKNIEMSTKFFDQYTTMRIEAIKSFDTYMHTTMDSYAKILSQFNKFIKSLN